MKAYRMKIKGSGEDIGYRLVSDKGNYYDVFKSEIPVQLNTEGTLFGKLVDREFKVGYNDTVSEVHSGSYILDIACINLGTDEKKKYGYSILSGEKLKSFVAGYDKLNRRSYVKRCVNELLKTGVFKYYIIELYGVRRTGKTVSMLHMISDLMKAGINANDICYISLNDIKGNRVSDSYLSGLLRFLSRKEKIQYIFVDEITYLDGTLDFLTSFGNGFCESRLIISGTNSSVFIMPNYTDLYDRALIIKTTNIPFSEYNSLYPDSTILDYIRSGGILIGLGDYKILFDDVYSRKMYKRSVGYVYASIFDNLIGSFDRYDNMCSMYPVMYRLYEQGGLSILKTLFIKFVQKFSEEVVVKTLAKMFSSSDIGRGVDLYKSSRRGDFISKNDESVKKIINKYLGDDLNIKNLPSSLGDLEKSNLLREMREYLEEIDCYFSIPNKDGAGISEYILPLLVRYGLACRVVNSVCDNWENICGDLGIIEDMSVPRSELLARIISNVEGVLCEEVIRLNLEMYRSGSTSKYRYRGNAEIDILYENDMIEVKKLDRVEVYQTRWLVNTKVYENFKGMRRVLLTNDESEKVMLISEYDALEDLINHKLKSGNHDVVKLHEELKSASREKVKVYCLNMTKYLLEKVSGKELRV